MDQKSGKTIEQVLQDLDNMLSSIGRKGRQGKNSNGGGSGVNQPGSGLGLQLLIIIVILAIYGAFTSFYKIEESQQGVVTRFGAFSHIADPGPHFKLPFGIDQVYEIEVTRVHELQFGFRKDSRIATKQARLESLMLTGDLNVAVVEWILNYKIVDPKKYLFHAVNVEKNIHDISISVMRRVVGDKLVSDVLTTDRVEIANKAMQLTQQTIDLYDMGILITKIALQNVTPPEPVKPAFNEINIARQEKERMVNEAQGIYNKIIPEAEGKANKIVAEAEAYAVARINRAKGDADRYREMLAAYQAAPQITRKRMYLETMQEIFSNPDKITIVDSQIKGLLPIFSNKEVPKTIIEKNTQEPEQAPKPNS